MFEWSDLRHALAIGREGTLSAAARSLGVAQTTVGRRLEALEGALGARLFVRTRGGLVPTDLGTEILELAQQMERSALAVERSAQGQDRRVEGEVRITTTESFARSHLVPRLAELYRLHPGLRFEVLTGNRSLDLDGREADLAVRLMQPQEPSLLARKIGALELGLYASAGYVEHHGMPRLGEGLTGHQVVAYAEQMRDSPEARWLRAHASRATAVLRTGSIPALVSAAVAGMGLAIMPSFLGRENPTLVPVVAPLDLAPRPIWLVFHADLQRDARVRAVVDHLVAHGATAPARD